MLYINPKKARALGTLGLAAIVSLVAACGGGGSSSTSTSITTTGSTSGGTTVIASGPVSNTPATLAGNQVAVVVSSATTATNMPAVTVKICQPGSTTLCATINNVQLDTGSYGLRLASSAVGSTMLAALTPETANGKAVAECAGFADGNSWGSVRTADVTIGGETASSVPIHILGDVSQTAAGGSSNNCASGTLHNAPSQLGGVNGILGIGTAKYDCGTGCQSTTANSIYYGCTLSGGVMSACSDQAVPLAQQVANPIRFFATDNNGVVLNMPTVGSSGAMSASGYLTFGLNTQANNAVPPSGIQTFTTDHFGDVKSASLNGTTYTNVSSISRGAFFDTGSNGLFFIDGSLTSCGNGFYCPSSLVSLQSSVTGFNGTTATVSINVQNANALFLGGGYAFSDLAGTAGIFAVDYGMPFFYGRTVYMTYDPVTDGRIGVATAASVAF
jgi:hypothetical protein